MYKEAKNIRNKSNIEIKLQNSTKMREKRTVPEFLNYIYPPRCGICGNISENFLCVKCNKVLEGQAVFGIDKTKANLKSFENHLYIFKYEGIIRNMIINYKFNEKSYLYKTFVNFLLKNKKFFKILKSYDKIIPVPISKKRMKQRGYNQSKLIANELSKKLRIDLDLNSLLKVKDIIEQSKLDSRRREENIKNAYSLSTNTTSKKTLENKKIILIDDVFTTGSTVEECAKTLKKVNPKKVDVLTIAKD